jgi:type VI secretion system protein ImpA
VIVTIEGLDLEALLAPIGETSVGVDVRNDFSPASLYFKLRDARAEARAAERAADSNPGAEGGLADGWRNVRSLAVSLLSTQAKDIEVAAWLTETLVRSDGLAGLAFGARLIGGLAERYWDNVFPMPDEDGMVTRVAPVTGLNGEGGDGTLIQPLQKLKLFSGASGDPVLLFQYEQSAELSTLSDEKRIESRLKAGVVPFDKMEAAARATSPGIFVGLRRILGEAQESWNAMDQTFDRLASHAAPPTRRVRELLEKVGGILDRYAAAPAAQADAPAEDAPEGAVSAVQMGEPASGPARARRLGTREDALATLGEIAEFFRRTEPQSPLAYTIDDAIRRGRLGWPELIKEIVQDEHVRNNILNSLGIRPVEG